MQSLLLLASLFKYDAAMQSIGEKPKTRIILSGVSPQVLNAINTSELKDLIGSDNIFQDTKMAFQKAEELSSKDSF